MKIKSVRFAYSVKIGKTEVTFCTNDRFSLDYNQEEGFLYVGDGTSVVMVPLTNIPYLEPELGISVEPEVEPDKEQPLEQPKSVAKKTTKRKNEKKV